MKRKGILQIIFSFSILFVVPSFAHAQVITSDIPATGHLHQTFVFRLKIDSGGKNLNAIEAYIRYPADLVDIKQITTTDSIVNLWVSEPRIDSDTHEIVLIGGIAGGAVMKDAPLVTIVARTKTPGTARFTLDNDRSGMYLNDGTGTRIPLRASPIAMTVSKEEYQPSVVIESSTHPDEFSWYPNPTAHLSWEAADSEWSYVVSGDPTTPVDTTPDTPTGSVEFSGLTDGIHYFILRQHIGDTWTDPVMRSIRVDTTPPEPFTVTKRSHDPLYGGQTVLVFQTTDATSGVARYVIEEDRETYAVDRGPVMLHNPNSSMIRVTAYDQAGNTTTTWLHGSASIPWKRLLMIAGAVVALVFAYVALKKRYQDTRNS